MSVKLISEAVSKGRILVSDGGWGTLLYQKGLKPGECPELWNIERFEEIKDIAARYIKAGASMVKTNSFGGSIYKLDNFGLKDKAIEINKAAAAASREAAGDKVWVLGSVGPTGRFLLLGDIEEEEMYQAFAEQAAALEEGGADAILIETMSDISEAVIAIKAARENTKCEVISTFTFEKAVNGSYRTMMGVAPKEALEASLSAGADIVGTNCGNGFGGMIDIVREMREVDPAVPILVHANAGLPTNVNGIDVYPETPKMMADRAGELIEAGANIIGGCCGTGPEHITAIRQAVESYLDSKKL